MRIDEYISKEEKKSLENRLSILEGQVRGIKQMIECDRSCDDILIQITSIANSLKSLGKVVLKSYVETKAITEIKNGNVDILKEVIEMSNRVN